MIGEEVRGIGRDPHLYNEGTWVGGIPSGSLALPSSGAGFQSSGGLWSPENTQGPCIYEKGLNLDQQSEGCRGKPVAPRLRSESCCKRDAGGKQLVTEDHTEQRAEWADLETGSGRVVARVWGEERD